MWFLVKVSVIGNRSSCLSHASLIVPWPALSCQLQPASAFRKSEEENEGRASSCRGRGAAKQTIILREKRDDGFSWRQECHFCHLVVKGGSKNLRTEFWTKLAVWYSLKKINVWGIYSVGQESEYDCGPLPLVSSLFVSIFCLQKILWPERIETWTELVISD